MLIEVLMQYSCTISHKLSPLKQRFHDSQIVIIMNVVLVSSVGLKRVDCIILLFYFRILVSGLTRSVRGVFIDYQGTVML